MNHFIALCNPDLCTLKRVLHAVTLFVAVFSTSGQAYRIEQIDTLFYNAQETRRAPDSIWAIAERIEILSREFNYEWGFLQSNLIKGIALYQKNELDSSAKTLLEVVGDVEALERKSFEEGRARNYLGLIYQRLNNFDKSENNFRQAAQVFEPLNKKEHYVMSLNNIGVIHAMRGQYSEALEIFLNVRDIALDGEIPRARGRLSRALTNISQVYSAMGQSNLAIDFAKQGLQLKKEIGDTVAMGNSYNIIGEIFFQHELYDSALFYHGQALQLKPSNYLRYTPIVYGAHQSIAQIYAQQGELEQAISLLLSSMKLRRSNENYQVNDAYNLIAQYKQELGQFDSAIYYSNSAFLDAVVNNDKPGARDASKRLSEIFFAMNRFDSAYRYQSLFHKYHDSIYNESTKEKYNNLRIELETSEKQKEVEVLQKQIEIDEKNRALLVVSIIAIIILSLAITVYLILRNRNRQLKLENEIEKGQSALQQQTLHMMNMSNNIQEIESGLKSMKKKEMVQGKDVQSLLNSIFVNRSFEREWEQLETHFSKIHPDFNSQLLRRHDNLTQKERRLLALVKLDLNTREIAGILSIEQRSVVMSRYRLKQKLGLGESEDLDLYVQTF
ncbi:MAG: tetratricopeptide repeat protein [Cyclobacteriaceae bacterium]